MPEMALYYYVRVYFAMKNAISFRALYGILSPCKKIRKKMTNFSRFVTIDSYVHRFKNGYASITLFVSEYLFIYIAI